MLDSASYTAGNENGYFAISQGKLVFAWPLCALHDSEKTKLSVVTPYVERFLNRQTPTMTKMAETLTRTAFEAVSTT